MCPNINFTYESQLFAPPAPAIFIELRSPDSPISDKPEKSLALVDTGADCTVVPWSIINRLNLQLVDLVKVTGYDEKSSQWLPVYSIHLTIPGLIPVLTRVIPVESDACTIIGRDIINEWLLKLDGPKRIGNIQT